MSPKMNSNNVKNMFGGSFFAAKRIKCPNSCGLLFFRAFKKFFWRLQGSYLQASASAADLSNTR